MDSHLHHLTFAFKGIKFAKFNCGLHQEFSTGLRIRSLPTFRYGQAGVAAHSRHAGNSSERLSTYTPN